MKKVSLVGMVLLGVVTTSGCSSLSKSFGYDDSVSKEDNYRVTQDALISPLELPPGFQNPNRNMDITNRQLMGSLNDKVLKQDIPSFQVSGMRVQSNLSERWLHIDKADANDVWERLQRFVAAQGFSVEEARKDVGIMRTNFLARKEIVPKAELSMLTRVLNSWRAETAQGALDRLTLRVQTDNRGGLDVFVRHSMVVETGEGGAGSWRSRPYHPEFEAEMIYQALVFLGSSKDKAVQQVAATEKRLESSLNGEFYGLTLKAGMEESWQHVLSLSDRAGFAIVSSDKANGVMNIKLPSAETAEKGFFSRLFSSDEKVVDQVTLKFKTQDGQTDVVPTAIDQQPLTAAQRKHIFQRMGVLE